MKPEDAEWKRISVRVPSDPLVDESYLPNLYLSVKSVFLPWFEKTEGFSSLPFSELLRAQHALAVTGTSGKEYNGATLISHNMGTVQVPPGRYRYEIYENEPEQRVHMSFQIERKLADGLSDQVALLRDLYVKQADAEKDAEPPHLGHDELKVHHGKNSSVEVIRLPGIDNEKIKVWNEIYGGWITHVYPRLADTPEILGAMGRSLNRVRDKVHGGAEINQILPDLEEYLYLGIHAHPFESVNFSLVMSQVNYILMRLGWRGVTHRTLDFYGIVEQFPDFQARFRRALGEDNPGRQVPVLEAQQTQKKSFTIVAHMAWAGDLYFTDATVVESAADRNRAVEGIKIFPPDLPAGQRLEYMVHVSEKGDSNWTTAGGFAGTKGECKAIEGFAARLVGDAAAGKTIYYQARLGLWEWTPIAKSGEYCGTRGQSLPVTGLRIWIE